MFGSVTIKDIKLKLGKLCQTKRKNVKMSQEELGELLGLSRYTIQKFENGKNATLDTALKIANHFGLLPAFQESIDKIIEEENNASLY